MSLVKPASIVEGHPGATVSPVAAPVTVIVEVAQAFWEMEPKSIVAEPVMKVGTVVESIEHVTAVPTVTQLIPVPEETEVKVPPPPPPDPAQFHTPASLRAKAPLPPDAQGLAC